MLAYYQPFKHSTDDIIIAPEGYLTAEIFGEVARMQGSNDAGRRSLRFNTIGLPGNKVLAARLSVINF